MALQTHINDIMMKRLTKAKAAMAADGGAAAAPQGGAAAAGDGGYGPRYEAHISEMQAKLDAANNKWATFPFAGAGCLPRCS